MSIKNPALFVSAVSGQTIIDSSSPLKLTFPRQLPPGDDGKAIQSSANDQRDMSNTFLVIQVISQRIMKKSKNEMGSAFYALQMACFMTTLEIKISPNTEMYLDQIRKVI